jgi:prepilin-type processing-associated H-X9-DG protein
VLSVFRCPTDNSVYADQMCEVSTTGGFTFWARGNYAANAGNGPLFNRAPDGIYGPNSPGWNEGRRRGVLGPNVAAKMKGLTDGASNTLIIGEVRAGIKNLDRRGTWAIPQAGASALMWFGQTGDDNGPNVCHLQSDDTYGLTNADIPLMLQECMTDYVGDNAQNQATVRSLHPGGVNIGLADGSARFISDQIDTGPCAQSVVVPNATSPSWPAQCIMSTWDKLIASGDDEVLGQLPN